MSFFDEERISSKNGGGVKISSREQVKVKVDVAFIDVSQDRTDKGHTLSPSSTPFLVA